MLLGILCALALFALMGCSSEGGAANRQVDEGFAAVTFPSVYFGDDADYDEVVAYLQSQEYTDIERGRDGSYTVTMLQQQRDDLVADLHARTKEQFDSIPNAADYPHITAVEYSDSFASVKLVSSTRTLNADEQGVWQGVGAVACLYQQVAGLDTGCTITYVDSQGKTIRTAAYA